MNDESLILQELNEANNELKWFTKNYHKIQKECSNKFVAIKNHKVVFCQPKLEMLIKELKKQKKDPANFLIDFVYGKEETLVV